LKIPKVPGGPNYFSLNKHAGNEHSYNLNFSLKNENQENSNHKIILSFLNYKKELSPFAKDKNLNSFGHHWRGRWARRGSLGQAIGIIGPAN